MEITPSLCSFIGETRKYILCVCMQQMGSTSQWDPHIVRGLLHASGKEYDVIANEAIHFLHKLNSSQNITEIS